MVNKKENSRFHFADTIKLLVGEKAKVITLNNPTKGATCSCLMVIDHINSDVPLVIANSDQVFNCSLQEVVDHFKGQSLDGGVITFDSVHPRWSYVRLSDENRVIETAEKRPVSRSAIAGFYYFAKGSDFVRAAMKSIEKGADLDGQFYVSSTFNEMILDGKEVGIYEIPNEKFLTLYSIEKIKEAQATPWL